MYSQMSRKDAATLRRVKHAKFLLVKLAQFIAVLIVMAFICGIDSIVEFIL